MTMRRTQSGANRRPERLLNAFVQAEQCFSNHCPNPFFFHFNSVNTVADSGCLTGGTEKFKRSPAVCAGAP